jgi:hypothetical protein
MKALSISLPTDDQLQAIGREHWTRCRLADATAKLSAALQRLPMLSRLSVEAAPDGLHDALQNLIACAVHARTQLELLSELEKLEQQPASPAPTV